MKPDSALTVPEGPFAKDVSDFGASVTDPLLAGAYVDFIIERGAPDGSEDRWDVRLTAPTVSSFYNPQGFDLTLTITPRDSPKETRVASTNASYGTLRVSKNGGEPETTDALFPLGLLRIGLFESCKAAPLEPEIYDGASLAVRTERALTYFEYLYPLISMVKIADQNKAIKALMLDAVQVPSWWKLLAFSFQIEPELFVHEAVRVDTALGPGYHVPFNLSINGDPALYATMTVVKPTGVLQLTGGIVAIDGFAPDRPSDRFQLRFNGAGTTVAGAEGLPLHSTVEWH